MQSTVHFLWCFVLVAFVTIAPSIDTQENRTNQRKRHVRQDFDASTCSILCRNIMPASDLNANRPYVAVSN